MNRADNKAPEYFKFQTIIDTTGKHGTFGTECVGGHRWKVLKQAGVVHNQTNHGKTINIVI